MEHTKDSLKVLALTQRMGKLVSEYEDQIADLRAEATLQVEDLQSRLTESAYEVSSLTETLKELKERYETSQEGEVKTEPAE